MSRQHRTLHEELRKLKHRSIDALDRLDLSKRFGVSEAQVERAWRRVIRAEKKP